MAPARLRTALVLIAVALVAGVAGGGIVALTGNRGTDGGATTAGSAAPADGTGPEAASWAATARRAARGVVEITASHTVTLKRRGSAPDSAQTETSFGSGIEIDRAGDIVTNAHVTGSAGRLVVHLPDGTAATGRLVGSDASSDLAVVRIRVDARRLHPLTLGAPVPLALGDPVLAIGTPLGYAGSVSAGIVSGFDREIPSPNGYTLVNAIQTDAAINHGSSGGPLLDAAGRVVGINAQIAMSGVNGNIGVAFAIPIDAGTRKVIAQLRTTGTATHAWLGIAGATLDEPLARALGLPGIRGVLVTGIAAESPAAGSRLKAGSHRLALDTQSYCVGGDVLVALGGVRIDSISALQEALVRYPPGTAVTIRIVHGDGVTATRSLTLSRQPARRPKFASGC